MNKNIQGHVFALSANILWGLMAPIGKSALAEFSPLSVTTFRMVGAAACFWLLSAFCKQEQVDHRDMLKIFFASLFALVFNQGVYIFGLSLTLRVHFAAALKNLLRSTDRRRISLWEINTHIIITKCIYPKACLTVLVHSGS